jgi:DNA-binding transcriptional ArsR family regulator
MGKAGEDPAPENDAERVRLLAAAFAHPLRVKLLNALAAESPLGADVLSARIAEPLHKVRRHLNSLVSSGLVKVVGEERRRGALKRYFAVEDRRGAWIVTPEEEASLSEKDRRRSVVGILRVIFDESMRAASNPHLGERTDRHVINVSDRVDEQGWRELSELHQQMTDRVLEVIAKSRDRLDAGEGRSIGVISEQILLEAPQNAPDARA